MEDKILYLDQMENMPIEDIVMLYAKGYKLQTEPPPQKVEVTNFPSEFLTVTLPDILIIASLLLAVYELSREEKALNRIIEAIKGR